MDMVFANNIKKLRAVLGLSQTQLADALGITKNAVSMWESGKAEPRMGVVTKIAEIYGVRVGALIEESGLDDLTDEKVKYLPSRIKAPLYGRIAAGEPVEMLEAAEQIGVPEEILSAHPNGFFLMVSGDSMNRVIKSGGYAFIDPDVKPSNGDIVAINVNGDEATLKRIHKLSTSIVLQPDSTNAEYKDIMYHMDDPNMPRMKILGKMVWMMYPAGFKY